jgi:hypothetical protein
MTIFLGVVSIEYVYFPKFQFEHYQDITMQNHFFGLIQKSLKILNVIFVYLLRKQNIRILISKNH